ncbi:hypothetical protein [Stenotrophomonas tumulicola]|uniref:Uncharacterized protein n=1 Tax=Stenotrophomonas tumulicola TaxID=1685415 RepID=A0A7W3IJ28_9GAMM|nr:hypothetical protein [Stenotrophomonas tumulicola]MBA8683750.1 hypothetical protein [Stenotrophomonas tumulicola]
MAQVALHAYRLVVRKYLPDDFPALQQKYLADWQKPFRSNVKVQYEYQGQQGPSQSLDGTPND